MFKFQFVFLQILIAFSVSAQFDHKDVFKGISGTELEQKLVESYKPTVTMPYGMARDTLYKIIDIRPGNKLECIYTGFQITLDPNEDPTIDAFDKGINAEHTYPQSKGAENGLARSDLHHLHPARENVNSDRSSHPYGESADNETDFWYVGGQKMTSIPSGNLDAYSELNLSPNGNRFEPREGVKGNIARGIFYFYTMYREEALNADAQFFDLQKEDLCQWHFDDPVDEREWNRSEMIAKYQDDKPNPFILDCSLASRLYCDQISVACELVTPVKNIENRKGFEVSSVYPIPSNGQVSIGITSYENTKFTIQIINTSGLVINELLEWVNEGYSKSVTLPLFTDKGIFYIKVTNSNGVSVVRKCVII